MSVTARQTSQERLTEALTAHGWRFRVTEAPVNVPDEDNAAYPSWHGARRRHVPRKTVQGVAVEFTNDVGDSDILNTVAATVYFTEAGTYVAEMTKGTYPVTVKMPLSKILNVVERRAPERVNARRALLKAQRLADADVRVARAQEEAAQAQRAASAANVTATHAVAQIVGCDLTEASRILGAIESSEEVKALRVALTDLQHKAAVVVSESSSREFYASQT